MNINFYPFFRNIFLTLKFTIFQKLFKESFKKYKSSNKFFFTNLNLITDKEPKERTNTI